VLPTTGAGEDAQLTQHKCSTSDVLAALQMAPCAHKATRQWSCFQTRTCTVSIMQSAAASRSLLFSALSSCVVTLLLRRPRFSSTRKNLHVPQGKAQQAALSDRDKHMPRPSSHGQCSAAPYYSQWGGMYMNAIPCMWQLENATRLSIMTKTHHAGCCDFVILDSC
jgi:hypothetical protein